MTAREKGNDNTKDADEQALPASAGSALAFESAIGEFFDWLTESEIAEDEVGNVQARDAISRASSQLGCLLIKHGVYTQNVQDQAPAPK